MQDLNIFYLRDCQVVIGEVVGSGENAAQVLYLNQTLGAQAEKLIPLAFFSLEDHFYLDELPPELQLPVGFDAETFIAFLRQNADKITLPVLCAFLGDDFDPEPEYPFDWNSWRQQQGEILTEEPGPKTLSFWPDWESGELPSSIR